MTSTQTFIVCDWSCRLNWLYCFDCHARCRQFVRRRHQVHPYLNIEHHLATLCLFLSVLLYFGVAILYYLGPRKRKHFKFFSPGATLATLLILIISVLYELYVAYYASYNELYGSLGTIIMLLLWIYLISYALLIGFELNASIHGAMQQKSLNDLNELDEHYDKSS